MRVGFKCLLDHKVTGIVVTRSKTREMRTELYLCLDDGTSYHISGTMEGAETAIDKPISSILSQVQPGEFVAAYQSEPKPRPKPRHRLSRGAAFRVPILQILRERGGSARPKDVLVELERRMRHDPSVIDRERLPSGAVRWKRRAVSEVRLMREERLIYPVWASERGVWMLAPDGSKIAEKLHADYKAIMEGAAGC